MQRARLARALGLLLVIGLGSSAAGCGSGAPVPVATRDDIRKDFQQKKAAALERASAERGAARIGKRRP